MATTLLRRSAALHAPILVGLLLGTATDPASGQSRGGDDSDRLLSIEHFVGVRSTAPGMAGEIAQLHVRERVQARTALRVSDNTGRVVIFVHGAGTPADVAFDSPAEGYSWMAFLARAGFDAFAMNVTGYGRSARPPAMNDPCNLSEEGRRILAGFSPALGSCTAPDTLPATTIASDWDDIDAVVEYVRALRGVEKVSLVAWSLGGPRAGGYAARHPEKVDRLVLLSPAYNRNAPTDRPSSLAGGPPMNVQSRAAFDANWDRQVGCVDQYDRRGADLVWREMLASDVVGATWGPGVRRAPRTPTWGWNAEVVGRTRIPVLVFAPAHDAQVSPDRAMELYEDLGSTEKVLVDLACSSHNAHWERNRRLMFQASLDWLTLGAVNGATQGIERLGY